MPGCPLCFLSAWIQWRAPVSIYIQMSPSILPGAGGRFYSLRHDALDKPFFPISETSLCCTVRKWGETQCILPLVPFLSSFCFTCQWYAIICVSRLEYEGFVSISLKDEAACCLKCTLDAEVVIPKALLLGSSNGWGFVVVRELLIQNEWLQVS